MDVDLVPGRIDHDDDARITAVGKHVAALTEGCADAWGIGERRDQVQIVVWARLFTQERVDRPATVKPHPIPTLGSHARGRGQPQRTYSGGEAATGIRGILVV
jgi:hypothetical protein